MLIALTMSCGSAPAWAVAAHRYTRGPACSCTACMHFHVYRRSDDSRADMYSVPAETNLHCELLSTVLNARSERKELWVSTMRMDTRTVPVKSTPHSGIKVLAKYAGLRTNVTDQGRG